MSFETLPMHRNRLRGRAADELFGLCLGVLADGYVNREEAQFLQQWLSVHPDVRDGSADPLVLRIYSDVREILSDDVFDPEEQRRLLALLSDFTGAPAADQRFDQQPSTLPLCVPQPVVVLPGRSFCFTGTFAFGVRSRCAELLERFGGVHSKNVTMKLDYLVIGHHITPDWRHQSYGAKIIKAMDYRDTRDKPVSIISEKHFIDSLRAVLKRGRS